VRPSPNDIVYRPKVLSRVERAISCIDYHYHYSYIDYHCHHYATIHHTMKGLPTDSSLPLPVGGTKPKSHKWLYLQLFAVLALLATQLPRLNSIGQNGTTNLSPLEVQQLAAFGAVCPVQPKALEPKIKLDLDEKYRKHSAKLLSEAVVRKKLVPSLYMRR
jgi:hypothetical protein